MNETFIQNYLINEINTNPFSYIFTILFKGLKKNTKVIVDLDTDLIKININDKLDFNKLNEYFNKINSISEYCSHLEKEESINNFDSILLYEKKYEIIIYSKQNSKVYKYKRYKNNLDNIITSNYINNNNTLKEDSYSIEFKYNYNNKLKFELLKYFNFSQLDIKINSVKHSFNEDKLIKEYSFIGSNWALLPNLYTRNHFLENKSLVYLVDNVPYLFSYQDLLCFIERLDDLEIISKWFTTIQQFSENNLQSFFIKINKNTVDYNRVDKSNLLFNKKTIKTFIIQFIKCVSQIEYLYNFECADNPSYLKGYKNQNNKYSFLRKKEICWKKESLDLNNLELFNCNIYDLEVKAYYSYNSKSNALYNYNIDYISNSKIKENNIYLFINDTNKKSVKKYILSYLNNIDKDVALDRFILVTKTDTCFFKWVFNELEVIYVSELQQLEKEYKKQIKKLTPKEDTKIYNRVYKKEYSTNSKSFNIFCKKELVYKYPKEKCYFIESKYFKPGLDICLFNDNCAINYYKFNENLVNYLNTKNLNNSLLVLIDKITSTYVESNNWYNLDTIIRKDLLVYSNIYYKLKTALFILNGFKSFKYLDILNKDNIKNKYYKLIYDLYNSCKKYVENNKKAVEFFNLIDTDFCNISFINMYSRYYHNFTPINTIDITIPNKEKLILIIYNFLNNFSLMCHYINYNVNNSTLEEKENFNNYNFNFIKYINLLSQEHDDLVKIIFKNNKEVFNLFNVVI